MKDLTKLKPNELIRLAIQDMKTTIAAGIIIDMNNWGLNVGKKDCQVCFAGSVMLQNGKRTNNANQFQIGEPKDLNYKQFKALDCIRKGDLQEFCNNLEIELPNIQILFDGKKINFPLTALEFDIEYVEGKEEEFYENIEKLASIWD